MKLLKSTLLITGVSVALTIGSPALTANAMAAPLPSANATYTAGSNNVLDNADMFTTAQEKRIKDAFEDEAKNYGVLPVLETVTTIGDEDIERYATRRANQLGVGDANADNGLYILISKDDRKLSMEPGIGIRKLISDDTVQSIIDETMIPQFKEGNQTQGVIDGSQAVADATLSNESEAGAPAPYEDETITAPPFNLGVLFGVLGNIVGIGVLATAITLFVNHRKKQKAAKESARKAQVKQEIEAYTDRMYSEKAFRNEYAALHSAVARKDRFRSDLPNVNFANEKEVEAAFQDFEERLREEVVPYSKIPTNFFKSRIREDESVAAFAGRIQDETPVAKAAYDDFKREERRKAEEAKAKEERRKKAGVDWKRLSDSDKESYALATDREKARLGESYFSDYNSEREGFFKKLANDYKYRLEQNAKRAFDRLPRSQRERIARASGSTRERYIQEYVPGFNPLMLGIYVGAASSFYSGIQADEARAASSSSSSSSSFGNSSFGSYDSSSSFGGGGFDGGGGSGSW